MTDRNTHTISKASGIVPQLVENELRILDIELAERLGFERPRDIRRLIKRYEEELNRMGVCATVAQTSGSKGGRPSEAYYLNKKQAIFITAKSETTEATEITIEVIERFDAYETGKITIKSPRKHRPAILSTFNTGYKIALKLGFDKNQAISYGDRYCRNKCGESPVEMMELPAMPAPTNDAYLLPTQIGKKLGGLSAIKVNKLLAEKGLQTSSKDSTSGCPWAMTETGKRYGRLFDGVRKNGTGTAITLKWSSNVIPLLSSEEKAA